MTTLVESRLGLDGVLDEKVELRQNWTEDELQKVFRAAYQQVFGRQGVYISGEFKSAESLLRQGKITVRDFVRNLAKSDFYKECFFQSNSQIRFIELNYKHLLGRAPYDQSEISYHVDLYASAGYEADIDSYIDSAEYNAAFGESIVPYARGFKSVLGQKTVGYTRLFELYRGPGTSSNSQVGGTDPRLLTRVARGLSNTVRENSSPSNNVVTVGGKSFGTDVSGDNRLYRVEVLASARGAAVRRSKKEYVVPYDRFSSLYQEIHRSGGKIISITPA